MQNIDCLNQLLEKIRQNEGVILVGQVVAEQTININVTSEDVAGISTLIERARKSGKAAPADPLPTLREVLLTALPHVEAGSDWEAVCMLAHDMKKVVTEQQIVDELAKMSEIPANFIVGRSTLASAYWDTGQRWPNWQIPSANRSKAKARRHISIAEAIYPLLKRF